MYIYIYTMTFLNGAPLFIIGSLRGLRLNISGRRRKGAVVYSKAAFTSFYTDMLCVVRLLSHLSSQTCCV